MAESTDRQGEIAARVFRGRTVEAEHRASVAVIDKDGNLTHYLGDPEHVTMARSAIKPFQVLPLIVTGAADKYGFNDEQISIMCGSHNGADEHKAVVLSILDRIGCTVDDLQCGAHIPMHLEEAKQYPAQNEHLDPSRNNCSGKHAGFLALTKFLGEDIGSYLDPNSRAQTLVKEAVAAMTDFPVEGMDVTIDGCSAPNLSTTPKNLAVAFKRLACGEGPTPEDAKAVQLVNRAMGEHPVMYSGEGRFDLALQQSFPGNVACKLGAEALEGIGFADPASGIAVKIHDGNRRALRPVCLAVLKQLGLVAKTEDFPYLTPYDRPEVRNHRGLLTGHVVADFALRKA